MLTSHSLIAQSDTIIVKVGDQQKKYTLHTKLLAYHSGYFHGALSGNFKETEDGIIVLSDVDTDAFDVFVDWVYEKKLPECVHAISPKDSPVVSIRSRAYVLADRLLVLDLKKELMDVDFDRFQGYRNTPGFIRIIYLFKNHPESDPMLQLVVDSFCINEAIRKMKPSSTNLAPELPHPFLVCVLLKLNEISKMGENEKKLKREDYEIKK
jgi:hypothetical protein